MTAAASRYGDADINPAPREWVALDLETTGLSSQTDRIIEIGAVRFGARGVLDEYETLVNPRRRLPDFIRRLTGIRQAEVDAAPDFEDVADDLAGFIDGAPVVAHNAPFDIGFLRAAGFRIDAPALDTQDLAYLARPSALSYSLESLTRAESVANPRPHRALDDARASKDLFLALIADLANLNPIALDEIRRLGGRSGWNIGALLDAAEEFAPPRAALYAAAPPVVDSRALAARLAQPRPLRASEDDAPVDADVVVRAFSAGGAFSQTVPAFEERPQQIDMAKAVAETVNAGGRLIVEAGTGVGKSLAYLLPAAIYAAANDKRVVVSTNTINLQEQLIGKDLPALKRALTEISPELGEKLRFCQLKGRANYLCYKRWRRARESADLEPDQARVVAKTMLWMADTETGDRSEINLGSPPRFAAWNRISAQRARDCPDLRGPCFLRAARDKALASHIVVVNHALLMSQAAAEGSAIPDADALIIDEAHNLESVATDQLGWRVGVDDLDEAIAELVGERGLLIQAAAEVSADAAKTESAGKDIAAIRDAAPNLRDEMASLLGTLIPEALPLKRRRGQAAFPTAARATAKERAAPAWEDLEAGWLNFDILMSDAVRSLDSLIDAVEPGEDGDPDAAPRAAALASDLAAVRDALETMRARAGEFVSDPSDASIYWATRPPNSSDVLLNAAPLHVGELLRESLYADKKAVIMTSATLAAAGSFDHVAGRLGFADSRQMALGSPFDFYEAALIYAPTHIPEPNSPEFAAAAAEIIADAAIAAGGRCMALFTSHAALRAAADAIRPRMAERGIETLAQGVDGPPRQIAERFVRRPESVLLGASSFWEGVDFAGDSLTVLIVTRLPFDVPSDPVFQARSELYQNPFMEYAVPQAIIRFKQGFGRLIRTGRDRGVAITLDSRVVTRRYGRMFIASLPKTRVTNGKGYPVSDIVTKWMERPE